MSQEGAADDKESLARAQLPYKAEYCKTSRAKCKKCSEPMLANSLKLATMVKSRWHDGFDASFYHVTCFFRIKRPGSVAEIRHFETLKYEDQKMLEEAIESKGLSVLGNKVEADSQGDEKVASTKKKGKKRQVKEADPGGALVNYDDFLVEYAKSGRAKCIRCEEKIDKDSIRLGKLDYNAETQWTGGPVPRWYHVDCFVKSQEKLEFYGLVEKLKDFKELEKEDQKMLKGKVKPLDPPSKSDESGGKKIKDEGLLAAARQEDMLLKHQSDRLFKLREHVNSMKKKDIETMLEFMKQKSTYKSPSLLIDMATDALLFGPLEKCPVCKKRGGIVLRGSSYICTKGSSEEEPCTYETREPRRGAPDVPADVFEKYEFFRHYEFIEGHRIFPSKFVKAIEQKEAENNNLVLDGAPLDGLSIGVIAWKAIQADKVKLQKKVTTLGGKILTALDSSVFVILSSDEQLARESDPRVEVAKALQVPFASPEFIFKIETKDDVIPQLKRCLIGDWDGEDIKARFNRMTAKAKVET